MNGKNHILADAAAPMGIDQIIQNGLQFHQQGAFDKAARLYEKALKKEPGNLAALNFLADARLREGKPARAIQTAQKALKLKADMPGTLFILGNALSAMGRHAEAAEHLQQAIRLKPDYADAYLSLGNAYRELGEGGKSLAAYEKLSDLSPGFAEARFNLANAYRREGLLEEAAEEYEETLRLAPGMAAAHSNLSGTLSKLNRPEEALDHAQKALALDPALSTAYVNAGNALKTLGNLTAAEAQYRKALDHAPQDASAHGLLATSLQGQGRFEEAFAEYAIARKLDPRSDLIRGDLSTAQLGAGIIAEGWDNHEARFAAGINVGNREFPDISRWNGEPLDNRTLLVWKEQGIGDDIRYVSCLPDLLAAKPETATCRVETDPRLIKLYARSFPGAIIEGVGANDAADDIDYQIPMGSLARLYRRTLEAFPATPGYLVPDPARRDQFKTWIDGLGEGLKVGFAWRSGNMGEGRSIHYTQIDDWAELLSLKGTELINLQYGAVDDELKRAEEKTGRVVHQADLDLFNDLDGVAALTASLDLVISAGTSAADMAGAVGTPTFIYTPAFHPMMLGTDHLPWYPSMQAFPRKWNEPMAEVVDKITAALAARL
ncbi:tetratricopeptide repeat protein [Tepidicaulis sp.]|uniref:tetratricopeptide repeat protein n=1 Tax=Tepidicaulis sp. TaxID=1920809 RepID=UPI003B5C4C3C